MNETKNNARRAMKITTALTLFVAGAEIFIAFMNYREGMNFLDLTSYVTSNKYIYFLVLIVGNLALLPSAVMLYKENGISLRDEIYDKKTLGKDIFIGLIALAVGEAAGLAITLTYRLKTDMAYNMHKDFSTDVIVMWIIALVLVSGIIKEIMFRGLAKRFCGPVMGEMTALLLFNVMFTVLDWHNYGYSFILGMIFIWAYKKSGHLISPMIAHALGNLISLFYFMILK